MKKLILSTFIVLLIVGCSSTKPTTFPGAPKWWTDRPKDKVILYGVGTALRPMPNLAEQTGTLRAKQAIAGTLDDQMLQILDDVQEESGLGLATQTAHAEPKDSLQLPRRFEVLQPRRTHVVQI